MNITAKELFGVGVRLIGLITVVSCVPSLFHLDYLALAPVVVGLILLTRADAIAQLCYPRDARERDLKDFREP
jgi:hypothetical protein